MQAGAFIERIKQGDMQCVDDLRADPGLAGVEDADGVPAVLIALYHGHAKLGDALAQEGASTGLHALAALGRLDEVEALLDKEPGQARAFGPDGFQPLHLAAFFAASPVLAALIARDAPVNEAARQPAAMRPLHAAAASRQAEPVRLLLEAGADPNAAQAGGFTPLMSAAAHGLSEMVEALLAAGADPGAKADDGRTPSDFARAGGFDEIADRLTA
jgi:ankyrin repeat protein